MPVLRKFARRGHYLEAEKLLNSIESPDVYVYSSVIAAFAKGQRDPIPLLQRMKSEMVKPNAVTYSSILKYYSGRFETVRARNIFQEAFTNNEVNIVVLNSFLHCLVSDRCWKEVLEQMKYFKFFQPTDITLSIILQACKLGKQLDLAEKIIKYSIKNKYTATLPMYNALLSVYVNCDETEKAESVVSMLIKTGGELKPDVITYTTILNLYANHGDIKKAERLMKQLEDGNGVIDSVCANLLLKTYFSSENIECVLRCFTKLEKKGVLSSQSYMMLLQFLGSKNRHIEADYFYKYAYEKQIIGHWYKEGMQLDFHNFSTCILLPGLRYALCHEIKEIMDKRIDNLTIITGWGFHSQNLGTLRKYCIEILFNEFGIRGIINPNNYGQIIVSLSELKQKLVLDKG